VAADTGAGVSPEDKEKLFVPYFSTKGRGTGLGLSICYGIVRAHGGEIQCWNNPGGAGSTFSIRIPVAAQAAAANAKEAGQ